jgi:hypothetical protein
MRSFRTVRLDRLEEAFLIGPEEAAGIDGDQHVGGAVDTLGLDPLDQLLGIALDQVDGDAGSAVKSS